jgi:hypothetical protein
MTRSREHRSTNSRLTFWRAYKLAIAQRYGHNVLPLGKVHS